MPVNHEQHPGAAPVYSLADLTSEHIAEMSRAAGEPDWLIEQRVTAWEHFAQSAPPEWRRTNLTRLQPADIHPRFAPQGTEIVAEGLPADTGVVISPLAEAVRSHADLVRSKLGTAVDPLSHKFSALRAALWQDGVFIHVPRNVEVAVPVQVRYTLPDGSLSLFPYTLVVLEAHARLTLIEDFQSHDSSTTTLIGPTSEIFAGPGSEINYISIQRQGAGAHHIGGQVIVLDRDAGSAWVSMALGGQVQHIDAETRLQGDGCRVTWFGATFANNQQHLVTAPWLRHVGTSTESAMDFKTVVTNKGYSVFDGMIKIEHESRATSTRLEEHAVHLSPEARSDSIPGLRIDTNDVAKAGHASTSGQVDEEQLFYMQARGIEEKEAKRLIVMGFFEPALNAVPLDDLREALVEMIEDKI